MSLRGIQLFGSEHVARQHIRARRGLQLLVSDIGLQRRSRARHGLSARRSLLGSEQLLWALVGAQ